MDTRTVLAQQIGLLFIANIELDAANQQLMKEREEWLKVKQTTPQPPVQDKAV